MTEPEEKSEESVDLEEVFFGCCWIITDDRGGWCPRVRLRGAVEAWNYVNLQAHLFPEIRITDTGDFMVIHVIAGELLYPTVKDGLEQSTINLFKAAHISAVVNFKDFVPVANRRAPKKKEEEGL